MPTILEEVPDEKLDQLYLLNNLKEGGSRNVDKAVWAITRTIGPSGRDNPNELFALWPELLDLLESEQLTNINTHNLSSLKSCFVRGGNIAMAIILIEWCAKIEPSEGIWQNILSDLHLKIEDPYSALNHSIKAHELYVQKAQTAEGDQHKQAMWGVIGTLCDIALLQLRANQPNEALSSAKQAEQMMDETRTHEYVHDEERHRIKQVYTTLAQVYPAVAKSY